VSDAGVEIQRGAVEQTLRVPGSSSFAKSRRSRRLKHSLLHGGVVAIVLLCIVFLGNAIRLTLAKQGIGFNFDFLWRPSGISLSEGFGISWSGRYPYFSSLSENSTNVELLIGGLLNSLKVAVVAVVASTVIGVAFGVARLSRNWLLQKVAFIFVEFVRNTPLLIQLVFWYFAALMQLPAATGAAKTYAWLIVSQSGVFFPLPILSPHASPAGWLFFAVGILLLFFAVVRRKFRRASLILSAAGLGSLIVAGFVGFPIAASLPQFGHFGPSGGYNMTPELAAILLAITVNSAAYVAEIVRGAIESLPRGQWEAASSLGFSRAHTLFEVVLPQVFRIVLPSLGNRYLSLTKDTSLGIAIGFPDLFNVSGSVANHTGRNFETIIIVMITYLIVSWVISYLMSVVAKRTSISGGR
jgi:general L-amino acid transport system permease protein